MKISVIMPVYNEIDTIEEIVGRVISNPLVGELIIIDDGSTDGTTKKIKKIAKNYKMIKSCFHDKNRGKGAAIRTGIAKLSYDAVIIQDADLEYDPSDYQKLLTPIEKGQADVVYGSRFIGSEAHRVHLFWHR